MKKTLSKIIAGVIIMSTILSAFSLLSGCSIPGNKYYISSSVGDDDNDGSESSPWKSFENLKNIKFSEGDKIFLKRGDIWNETMYIHANGSPEHYVTVTSYGDKNDAKPSIRLNNESDDICIVCEDIAPTKPIVNGLSYVCFDGLDCRNSRIGLYVRLYFPDEAKGIKIINCDFYNMTVNNFTETLVDRKQDEPRLAADMAAPKDSLSTISFSTYKPSGGGIREFAHPAGITVGGVNINADTNETYNPKLSNLEIDNCRFLYCYAGMSFWFYGGHNITGSAENRLIKNIRITNCYIDGTTVGGITMENADGGYTGPGSYWGIINNVRTIGGQDMRYYSGTTGFMFQTCKNFELSNCEFSYINNNGSNDGCGFDFEGSDYNFILRNSIFHNNEAHAILMMQAIDKCKNVTLKDILFYNNITNPQQGSYLYDMTVFNNGNNYHENIIVDNTIHYLNKINPLSRQKIGTVGVLFNGITVNSESNTVDDYSSRWAFNKNGNSEGFGLINSTNASVNNGQFSFKTGNNGSMFIENIGVNSLAMPNLAIKMNAEKAGKATVYVKTISNNGWNKVSTFNYSAGEGSYVANCSNSDSAITGYKITFGNNTKISVDYIEAIPDIKVNATKLSDNKVLIEIGGSSLPDFCYDLSKESIVVDGADIANIEYKSMTEIILTLDKNIDKSASITLLPSAFTEYCCKLASKIDGCDRPPEQEAELRGYSETQKYYDIDLSAKIK